MDIFRRYRKPDRLAGMVRTGWIFNSSKILCLVLLSARLMKLRSKMKGLQCTLASGQEQIKFADSKKDQSLQSFFVYLRRNSFSSDFTQDISFLYMCISALGQWQKAPLGQNFGNNRKPLSLKLFAVNLTRITFVSKFTHDFS